MSAARSTTPAQQTDLRDRTEFACRLPAAFLGGWFGCLTQLRVCYSALMSKRSIFHASWICGPASALQIYAPRPFKSRQQQQPKPDTTRREMSVLYGNPWSSVPFLLHFCRFWRGLMCSCEKKGRFERNTLVVSVRGPSFCLPAACLPACLSPCLTRSRLREPSFVLKLSTMHACMRRN